jgi:signal transduction histidine kinase
MLDSFRSRLVISNLLITLVGLLVVVGVFTSILVQRSTDVRKSDRAQQARRIAVQVDALFARHGRNAELQQLVSLSGRLLQARIIIVGTDGLPFNGFKEARGSSKFYRLDPNALKQAESAVVALRQNNNYYTFQSPLLGTHGRPAGAVLLVARVADVRPDLGSLGGVFVAVLITALLVWLTIGLYFTFSISRPLVRIRRATVRMAQGDYDVRVPAQGDGEIALLASRFNEMAERVQSSNRVLRDFVANVSHDLRTPLTMITGFSQALLDGTAGPGEVTTSAEYIYEESVKMQRLVEDLLQLTRLESGLQSLQRHPLELRPFVQNLLDRIARGREEPETAALRNDVADTTPPINVDEGQLERALRNLVDNALRYTPSEGSVTVSASSIGVGWVEISVRDTGAGIPPQDLNRVFERFYRSDKSRERAEGSSGLGLAIVREIVEGHGGHVQVESEVGKGTTFRFTVPQVGPMVRTRTATHPGDSLPEPAHS